MSGLAPCYFTTETLRSVSMRISFAAEAAGDVLILPPPP